MSELERETERVTVRDRAREVEIYQSINYI